MMVYEHPLYIEDLEYVTGIDVPWEKMWNGSILVSGATGMIGSFLVDVIMRKNEVDGLNCKVYAIGRNADTAKARFGYCWNNSNFVFVEHDVNEPILLDDIGDAKYIIHLASNTHPISYSNDPIGTITTNVIGTMNMMDFAVRHNAERMLFASSNEIYGENRGDVEKFDEDYCGYINCNTLRAGYSESTRCGEALCQAYGAQKGLNTVIPRFTRTFGPTLLNTDTKALSQFLHKAILKENIVLKSDGNQFYSYTYVADAVSGLLVVLLKGNSGEAYNISDESCDIKLKDLAKFIADYVGKNVIYENPSDNEKRGYSVVTKARLDNKKIKTIGWTVKYDMASGIERTIKMLSEMK